MIMVNISGLSLEVGLSYGLTPKIVLGVIGQYLLHTNSNISFAPYSNLYGQDMDLEFKSGLEEPVFAFFTKEEMIFSSHPSDQIYQMVKMPLSIITLSLFKKEHSRRIGINFY